MANRRDYAGGAAATTITAGINATDLSISIASSAGWPSGVNGKFFVVIDAGTSSEEKVLVQSRSGTTLTVASTGDRGVDGTAAGSHGSSSSISHCGTATDLDEANAHITDISHDDHTQYLNVARHDLTARHPVGSVVPAGTPSSLAIGGSNTAGAATTVARSDHVHATPAAAAPSTLALGGSNSAGVATTISRSDHVHALPAADVVRDAVLPPGVIIATGAAAAPSGWLLCDGTTVSRTTYAALFAAVGTSFNTGGEAGTDFRLPNAKGKVLTGLDAAQSEFNVMGDFGGAKTHSITTAEMPTHNHSVDPPATNTNTSGGHAHTASNGQNFVTLGGPAAAGLSVAAGGDSTGFTSTDPGHTHSVNISAFNSADAGGGGAMSLLQPYLTVNVIIKT